MIKAIGRDRGFIYTFGVHEPSVGTVSSLRWHDQTPENTRDDNDKFHDQLQRQLQTGDQEPANGKD